MNKSVTRLDSEILPVRFAQRIPSNFHRIPMPMLSLQPSVHEL